MLRSSGILALTVAALVISCYAEPRQDSERKNGDNSADSYEASGHKTERMDLQKSNNLIRQVRETQPYGRLPFAMSRRHDHSSPSSGFGDRRVQWPTYTFGGFPAGEGGKRNFDEIDLSGLNTFVRKRNMDQNEQTLMPFQDVKHFDDRYKANLPDVPE